MDSARTLYISLEKFNVKEVYNYMICNCIYKSISRNDNIFVRYECQQITRQALYEVLHAPYTPSTQTLQSFTFFGIWAYITFPVNIRRRKRLVSFKYRLKTNIMVGGLQYCLQ